MQEVHSTEVTNKTLERIEVSGTDIMEKTCEEIPMLKETLGGIVPLPASAKDVNLVTAAISQKQYEMGEKINTEQENLQRTIIVVHKIQEQLPEINNTIARQATKIKLLFGLCSGTLMLSILQLILQITGVL